VPNSALFKAEFVEMLFSPNEDDENPLKLDESVFEQV